MTVEGLEIRLAAHGLNVRTISAWMADEIAVTWEPIWTTNHPEIRAAYGRIGEPAYGIYNRELFRPVQRQLDLTGMTCSPRLPGTLPLSEEEWGAEDHRERRMWTLLLDGHRAPVGAIVTRFFHDHTRLRLPQPPTVVGLTETDHDRIRALVLAGGEAWSNV